MYSNVVADIVAQGQFIVAPIRNPPDLKPNRNDTHIVVNGEKYNCHVYI
jgi:hypothetical protein